MTQITVADFAALSPDDKVRVFADLERVAVTRHVDPKLRADILRCTSEGLAEGRITDAEAEAIRHQLDEAHPAIVLEQWWRKLIPPNRPALGAFPRRESPTVPTAEEWLLDNPRRLASVVHEMRRFTDDLPRIIEGALDLADRVGIDSELADKIVCGALREKAASRAG